LENSFLQLWLDSGEYEEFAQDELLNPESPINREGLRLRGELESVRRSYFTFFQKLSYETWEYEGPEDCPLCHSDLVADKRGRGDLLVCEFCIICFINLNGANPLTPVDEWRDTIGGEAKL
jgi:predicted  nucleic acid-binding Zn ribbon protein